MMNGFRRDDDVVEGGNFTTSQVLLRSCVFYVDSLPVP